MLRAIDHLEIIIPFTIMLLAPFFLYWTLTSNLDKYSTVKECNKTGCYYYDRRV